MKAGRKSSQAGRKGTGIFYIHFSKRANGVQKFRPESFALRGIVRELCFSYFKQSIKGTKLVIELSFCTLFTRFFRLKTLFSKIWRNGRNCGAVGLETLVTFSSTNRFLAAVDKLARLPLLLPFLLYQLNARKRKNFFSKNIRKFLQRVF